MQIIRKAYIIVKEHTSSRNHTFKVYNSLNHFLPWIPVKQSTSFLARFPFRSNQVLNSFIWKASGPFKGLRPLYGVFICLHDLLILSVSGFVKSSSLGGLFLGLCSRTASSGFNARTGLFVGSGTTTRGRGVTSSS